MVKTLKTSPKFNKTLLLISILINLLFISLLVKATAFDQQKDESKNYPLLSPRIFVENQNDLLINFLPLRKQLRDYASKLNNKIGIYFEYLPTGTSIGVNDRTEHQVASLLKTPLAIAYYYQQNHEGIVLDAPLEVKEKHLDNGYGNLWLNGAGQKIMPEEAIRLMLQESDNTAQHVMEDQVKQESFDTIYNGLDIDYNFDEKGIRTISPKTYSSIYRALYLSSLLPKADSNHILEILSQSTATSAIPAGLPENIKVAHKIGQESDILSWDCGIVYVPKRPYILCMFATENHKQADQYMKEVSGQIYNYVKSAADLP